VKCLVCHGGVFVDRNHKDLRLRQEFFELATGVHAVQKGQAKIDDNQIRAQVRRRLEEFQTVGGRSHDFKLLLQ